MANDPGEAVRENYRKQGAQAERERIIQLLEDKQRKTDYRGNGPTFSIGQIIALINGENNA